MDGGTQEKVRRLRRRRQGDERRSIGTRWCQRSTTRGSYVRHKITGNTMGDIWKGIRHGSRVLCVGVGTTRTGDQDLAAFSEVLDSIEKERRRGKSRTNTKRRDNWRRCNPKRGEQEQQDKTEETRRKKRGCSKNNRRRQRRSVKKRRRQRHGCSESNQKRRQRRGGESNRESRRRKTEE